jgi:hypothetical protein
MSTGQDKSRDDYFKGSYPANPQEERPQRTVFVPESMEQIANQVKLQVQAELAQLMSTINAAWTRHGLTVHFEIGTLSERSGLVHLKGLRVTKEF